jgi:hypothetical protein
LGSIIRFRKPRALLLQQPQAVGREFIESGSSNWPKVCFSASGFAPPQNSKDSWMVISESRRPQPKSSRNLAIFGTSPQHRKSIALAGND